MRDRLIKLLREAKEYPEKTCPKWEAPTCFGCDYNKGDECDRTAKLADYLLKNGVVVFDTDIISPESRPLIQTVAGMPLNEVIELVKAKQSNRVIVPPCKTGDTVYWADRSIEIKPQLLIGKVFAIGVDENSTMWISVRYQNGLKFYHTSKDFEKYLFLTPKEAEKALKEVADNTN